jgi:hypothetical protein
MFWRPYLAVRPALLLDRAPSRNRQGGVLAVGQALVPSVIEVRVVRGGAAGHQITPDQAILGAGGSGSRALFSTVITGSLLAIIPLVVAFIFLQRYWQSGLATGSVKA